MKPQPTANRQTTGWLWAGAVAVLLLAAFLRFYQLDNPLGLFFDPAINGLDTTRLMQRGGWVLFFPTNGGRESLFMYLLVPFVGLFGPTPFAMRALPASLSLLNVALLFAFIHDLRFTIYDLRNTEKNSPVAGSRLQPYFALLTALALAALYWHVLVSRLGQRPMLVPLVATPLFWVLLRGWHSNRRRWFALAGGLLGLAGYTYPAARILPVILLLALLPEFFTKQSHLLKTRLVNLAILLATAALVYLPMAGYLLTHPAQFTVRAGSVMVWRFLGTPAEIAAELGRNLLRVAGFFCCVGSPNPIFGLPGYPGLSPLLAPFLLLGLAIALKNWRNLFCRLAAVWWLVGVAPSVIAIEAPHPLRMIVAIPPTAILTALGLIKALPWASRFSPSKLMAALPALLILLPLPGMFRAYYMDWPSLPVTRGAYDYGAVAIRNAALPLANGDTPLYLPLDRFNNSTLLYYLGGSLQREARLTAPPAASAMAISPDKSITDTTWVRLQHGTITVLPPLTTAGQQLLRAGLTGSAATPIRTVTGETAARLATLPADPGAFSQQPTLPLEAGFGPLRLTGANFAPALNPPAALPVTLFWAATATTNNEYEVLVRLVDDSRRAWGNGDARPTDWVYPTSWWRPGLDQIAAQHEVKIDPALPPGRYWLAVSVFDTATGQRLPLTTGTSDAPDTFFIGPLKMALPPPANLPPPLDNAPVFGNVARLNGARIEPATARAGHSLQVELDWQAQTTPPLDYTVFVHLLDKTGQLVAGSDAPPLDGRYPTTIWSPGERILDAHRLELPANLPPGQYQVAVGLYHQPTGQRLPLQLPGHPPDAAGQYHLPPLTVAP